MAVVTAAHPPTTALRPVADLRRGAVAMAPLLAGVAPLGLLVGAAIAEHGDPAAGLAGTWLVYGASAHLALLQLTDAGAGVATVVATCLLINARLVVYSAGLGRHWRGESTRFKALMAFTVVDPAFAVGDTRYREPGDAAAKRWHYVGAAVALWFGWAVAIAAGATFAPAIGELRLLAMALPACLVAMIAPTLRTRPGALAIGVSMAVAALAHPLPSGAGLLLAIVAGATAGAIAEGRPS